MDVLADGRWEKTFKCKSLLYSPLKKRAWLDTMTDGPWDPTPSFPFGDTLTGQRERREEIRGAARRFCPR